jgi:butyryl-CoA dehydrogenase
VAGAASQKYMTQLADQQEILAALADIIIEAYAAESAVLRAQKMVASQGEAAGANAVRMAQVYLEKAFAVVEQSARKVIAAVAEGDMLRTQMTILRRLAKHEPMNTIALRQQIADRMIEAGRYTV